MKKLIFISLFLMTSLFLSAQVTSPRNSASRNTSAQLYGYTVAADTAGTDTVFLRPRAQRTLVKIAVLDSIVFRFHSVSNSYYGDEVIIIATNASGSSHRIKVASTNAVPAAAGDVTLASTLGAVIRYIFNGVKWVEHSRAVQ